MDVGKELRTAVEIIPERLYYVSLTGSPANNIASKHFFSIDAELVYWNFYLDFGPLNLGQLYRFCQKLNDKLADPKLKEKAIYYYSGTHGHRRANATYLICSWSVLFLGRTPEEAFKPFRGSAPLPPWHDATPTSCTFNLTVLDTLRGLQKARECGFFDFDAFDIAEYEHYEQVENGDLNWIVPGKFIAFAGPQGSRDSVEGYKMLTPDDFISYFKKKRVSLVVRLNKKYYEAKRFTVHGIDHIELYFLDGSNPPDHILAKFLQVVEETPGAVAVHCKAGLGRTGCCIGSYLMKHYRFTAEEVMGWLRIVRPGSIIGPQQNWIKDMQMRMWREGEAVRARLRPIGRAGMESEGTEEDSRKRAVDSGVGALSQDMEGVRLSSSSSRLAAADARQGDEFTQGDYLQQRKMHQTRAEGALAAGGASTSQSPTSAKGGGIGSTFGKFLSSWK